MSKFIQAATLEIEHSLWSRGFETIAGIDEAGRGPLAGPVVAAAAIFPRELIIEGVADSKRLSPKRREECYERILAKALSVGVGIVYQDVIDRINIFQATMLAMHQALENLSVKPDFVIVDGPKFCHSAYRFQAIVDGDARSFTIAAASIVAKVTRDRMMCEWDARYPEYGFAVHKGYGTLRHLEAIRKFGLCEIHRRSFRPCYPTGAEHRGDEQ
jgi:ribonuclease HII